MTTVLRYVAHELLAGVITPLEATTRADAINVRSAHAHDSAAQWSELHEELAFLDRTGLSYLGRTRPAVEADVVALARSILA